jgi:hypothetical protein
MEQLIKLVSDKTGISADQAKQAILVVTNFLKDKLPAGFGSQLDSLVSGQAQAPGIVGGIDNLGGMLGK